MAQKKLEEYYKILSQPLHIELKDEDVIIHNDIRVVKLMFPNNICRYYIDADEVLIKMFGYAKCGGSLKTEYLKNGNFKFPEVARVRFPNSGYRFVLLLDKNVFKALQKNGMAQVNDNNISNMLSAFKDFVDVNKGQQNDTQQQKYDFGCLQDAFDTEDTNKESDTCSIKTSLPDNYDEIIQSFHLEEEFGRKNASEIEKIVRSAFQQAVFTLQVPVRVKYVDKELSEEYKYYEEFTHAVFDLVSDGQKKFRERITTILEEQAKYKEPSFDASKLHEFVSSMEIAIAERIHREHKEIPVPFIITRLRQEACRLMYPQQDGSVLTLEIAKNTNAKQPNTYNLGDELLGALLVSDIMFHSNYDIKLPDGRKCYIPILYNNCVTDTNNGLLDTNIYNNILINNIVKMFPGMQKEAVNARHINMVYQYCYEQIRGASFIQ